MLWKVLGSILLLKYGISFSQFIWLMLKLYALPAFGMRLNLKKYGSWAVVTGATDGIGKAIAKQLAKRGINLVLISRTEEKLKTAAKELESLGVQVKIIVFDFSQISGYEKIQEELKDLDVGILVNNVGIGNDHPDFFSFYSDEFYQHMINLNVSSVLKMTRCVLDGMVKRKKGLILHVSSSSSLTPVPLMAVYSASKVFVNNFGQALGMEYAKEGIISQVVVPYFVATKLSKMRPNGIMVPTADAFAKQTVNAMGLSPMMTGFWSHEMLVFIQNLLPSFLVNKHVYNLMDATRRRWLKKQQQKKE